MDPDLPRAEAVLMLGNRIYDVGSTEKITDQITSDTELFDLAGRTVTPGFVDAHAHPLGYGLAQAGGWVDCSDAACIDDLVAKAEDRARKIPAGEWIFGRGWPASRLERWPTRQDFDTRVPDHPMWFNDLSGHLYILNSRGLAAVGIDRNTSQPPNGRIDRDELGALTGIIRDCDPWDFADMPPFFSSGDIVAGLRAAMRKATVLGLTTLAQIGIAIPPGPYGTERIRPWLEFYQAGELAVRIRLQIEPYAMLQAEGEYTLPAGLGPVGADDRIWQ